MTPELHRRLKEGRCPKCGELGPFLNGSPCCSLHGLYEMVLSVPEIDEPIVSNIRELECSNINIKIPIMERVSENCIMQIIEMEDVYFRRHLEECAAYFRRHLEELQCK
jgi:hypothetical protein